MSIILKEVSTRSELKQFIQFQFSLYKDNKYWVPPLIFDELKTLRKDKNPAFDFCEAKYWLAYKDEKIVGRIAGIINHKYNEKWNQKSARFGWIDFIDDEQVLQKLIEHVINWAKEKGMNKIHGPLGFTDLDGEGMLIEGFDELSTFGSIYNHPYYKKHIEKLGFEKDADWIEFTVNFDPTVAGPEKVSRIANAVAERNHLRILRVKKAKEMLPYAREIFYLINEAYKNLFGFVELTDKQIDMYVKAYFGFIKPDYVPIILDTNNKVAAFGITMPSLSIAVQKSKGKLFPFGFIHILKAMKNNPNVDLYLTAVRPELQNKGVNAMLINEMHNVFVRNNIQKVETNRELEENSKIQAQWRFFENRLHKRRRCYKKSI
ncbi:MAG: GNAT family N-acetyltransferase [Melioribacteraceae bacterium]